MAVADFRDLIGGQPQIAQPIIDQDEIVPGAVHLAETQHGRWLPQSASKAKHGKKDQAPSTKLQRSSKFQAPTPHLRSLDVWSLVFLWCLELGASQVAPGSIAPICDGVVLTRS